MSLREVKVCLLGETGVGKTSLSNRFVNEEFNDKTESTIGAAFLSKSITFDGQNYKFQIWDTAGQEKYKSLAPMYYRGSSAAIVVYDITHFQTYNAIKGWVKDLQESCDIENFVLIIAGNKSDCDVKRAVSSETVQKYANSIGAYFFETSAVTGQNVVEMFANISSNLPNINPFLDNKRETVNFNRPLADGTSPYGSAKKRSCCKGL